MDNKSATSISWLGSSNPQVAVSYRADLLFDPRLTLLSLSYESLYGNLAAVSTRLLPLAPPPLTEWEECLKEMELLFNCRQVTDALFKQGPLWGEAGNIHFPKTLLSNT